MCVLFVIRPWSLFQLPLIINNMENLSFSSFLNPSSNQLIYLTCLSTSYSAMVFTAGHSAADFSQSGGLGENRVVPFLIVCWSASINDISFGLQSGNGIDPIIQDNSTLIWWQQGDIIHSHWGWCLYKYLKADGSSHHCHRPLVLLELFRELKCFLSLSVTTNPFRPRPGQIRLVKTVLFSSSVPEND